MSSEEDYSDDFGASDEEMGFDDGFESQQSEVDDEGEDFADMEEKKLKVYDTKYKVVSPKDIEAHQVEMSTRVSALLGLTAKETMLLLSAFKWHEDSLVERFMEDSDRVCELAGVPAVENTRHDPDIEPPPEGFFCLICCEDVGERPDMKTFALACEHRLCTNCYGEYVTQKITTEAVSRGMPCFGEKCKLKLTDKAVKEMVRPEVFAKYIDLSDKLFVEDSELLAWCPAPNCTYAVECNVRKSDLASHVPSVKCECGHAFCFGCKLDDHLPCSCVLAKMWLKKCQDDSETANWISANTKDCPKCHSCIEKNGGCNHMTCKKCRYEFCWMCMGDWRKHGQQYYNCSRYADVDGDEARTEQEKSRAELERYLFYYNRYANHLQSLKLDRDTFENVEVKMKELQETSGMSWIEVQFLHQAFEALQACRRTLCWAYAFAYFLKKNNRTAIFEDNQNDLEMATEQLSEIFEQEAPDLAEAKVKMMDKSRYVMTRRDVLLTDAVQGLHDGTWEYNVTV